MTTIKLPKDCMDYLNNQVSTNLFNIFTQLGDIPTKSNVSEYSKSQIENLLATDPVILRQFNIDIKSLDDGEIDSITNRITRNYIHQFETKMETGSKLSGNSETHSPWLDSRKHEDLYYWERYKSYLEKIKKNFKKCN